MNIDRLKLMVTLLREVSAGTWKPAVQPTINPIMPDTHRIRFDIGTWMRGTLKDDCGFAACAVGHACLDQRFIDQGLFEDGAIPTFKPTVQDTEFLFQSRDWSAVKNFFGLSQEDVEWVFHGDSYTNDNDNLIEVTPDMVADRIEELLAMHMQAKKVEEDQLLKDLDQ